MTGGPPLFWDRRYVLLPFQFCGDGTSWDVCCFVQDQRRDGKPRVILAYHDDDELHLWDEEPHDERVYGVQERPRWSLLAALTLDSTKWIVGDVQRSGVAGVDVTSRLRVGKRDVWTLRTGSRNFGVGFSDTTVPMMTGVMHTIASGTGYLELGVEAGAYLDFNGNRSVEADFAMSARLSLVGHSRSLRTGVYVDFFTLLRLAPRNSALALGGGMTVGFTFDRYGP